MGYFKIAKFMIIKKTFLITAVFFLSASFVATAAALKNAGFIQGNIWYSEDPFYVGDKIRIYSAIFNNSGSDLIGIVEFYDGAEKIGSSNFSAINGRLVEVWTDWMATAGRHKIYAKIVETKIAKIGGGYEAVDLPNTFTGSSEKSAFIKPEEKKSQALETVSRNASGDFAGAEIGGSSTSSTLLKKIKTAALVATQYAKSGTSFINSVAEGFVEKIESKKIEVKKELDILNDQAPITAEQPFQFEKPLKYLYLASLSALGFMLEYKILLYSILLFVAFKVIKLIF